MEKIKENRLKWFSRVIKREILYLVEVVTMDIEMNVKGRKERRRPKQRWLNANESDIKTTDVCIDDMEDRF